ncbi:hypothetical protein PRUPE_7G050800 [Prunus persica]|uniref:Fatty acid hydroxylase domain-containing protein n=1 Tax=Prunus persica TaxID=3760 RepID=A0A251N6X0_PRUPE|nr:hypothetical protein PRUPE_7G050800 [Prunus persica]
MERETERQRYREKEHNLQNLPLWNTIGFISTLVLHVGVSEPLYYWMHRRFHGNYFFENYHSLHRSSPLQYHCPLQLEVQHFWSIWF